MHTVYFFEHTFKLAPLRKKTDGFTLVELAIVITIIGLLIGGVLKGQEMIQNARVTATIAQVNAYRAAIATFRDKHDNFPGDISFATTRIPGCTAANFCLDGDGNGRVGVAGQAISAVVATQSETPQFWKHLALADLISGINSTADWQAPAWGQTHPAAPIAGGFEFFFSTNLFGYTTHNLRLTNAGISAGPNTETPGQAAISPRDGALIDRKMDDGWPRTGSVLVWDYGNWGCDNMTDGSVGIDETITIRSCTMFFTM